MAKPDTVWYLVPREGVESTHALLGIRFSSLLFFNIIWWYCTLPRRMTLYRLKSVVSSSATAATIYSPEYISSQPLPFYSQYSRQNTPDPKSFLPTQIPQYPDIPSLALGLLLLWSFLPPYLYSRPDVFELKCGCDLSVFLIPPPTIHLSLPLHISRAWWSGLFCRSVLDVGTSVQTRCGIITGVYCVPQPIIDIPFSIVCHGFSLPPTTKVVGIRLAH